MPHPSAIFFDFDDTLHDFGGAYRAAFASLVHTVLEDAPPATTSLLRNTVAEVQARSAHAWDRIWERFMIGELTEEGLWSGRMRAVMDAIGVPLDDGVAQKARNRYLEAMEEAIHLYPDVHPALRGLRALPNRPVLAVLTNGPATTQAQRLQRLGLDQQFDFVLISGAIGVGKPDPRFFAEALARSRVSPDRAVMIGDNPVADIGGAKASGLRAVWVNRNGTPWPDRTVEPDAVAHNLLDAVAAAQCLLRKGEIPQGR